jgi:acid phosphatase family membrane protein YuiD
MPVAMAKMFGSKMMSSAGKPSAHQQIVGALADSRSCAAKVSAWPCSSKAMTITAAP